MVNKLQTKSLSAETYAHLHTVLTDLFAKSEGLGSEFLRFRDTLEHFPEAILVTSENNRIIYVNPSWEALSGYTMDEVEGKNPKIFQSNNTPADIFKEMWNNLSKGKIFTSEKFINTHKNGQEIYLHTTIFPVSHQGETIFYVQIAEDISSRIKLEAMQAEFLSTVSHELKTPITALKLLIEMVIRKMGKGSIKDISIKHFEMIDNELNRLTRIVNDLSDVSRIDTGKLKIQLEEVNLHHLTKRVIWEMRFIVKDHKITYSRIPKNGDIKVQADPDRIKQVLFNLIKNAVKYSPPKTTIAITLKKKTKTVTLNVKDAGEGIAKNKLPRIFERFYQIKDSIKSGFGLGLYISKTIINQHHGKIWAESEVGKGSTFSFSLPLLVK